MVDTSGRKFSEFVSEARAAQKGEGLWSKITRGARGEGAELGGFGKQVDRLAGRYSDDAVFLGNTTLSPGGSTFNPNAAVPDGGDATDAAIIARQASGRFGDRIARQEAELAALQRGFGPEDLGTAAANPTNRLTDSDFERAKALGRKKAETPNSGSKPAAPNLAAAQKPAEAAPAMEASAVTNPMLVGAAAGGMALAIPKENQKPIGEEAGVFKALQPVESVIDTTTNVLGGATLLTDAVLPAAGWLAGIAGFQKTRSFIRKPVDYLNPEHELKAGKLTKGDKINNGLMLGISGMQAYGVAKGFTQNLDALKHMYSDITGVPADKVSTMTILSGKVPDVMKEPRAHFIREHVIRGGINALGVGLIARAMFKGKAMGYIEGLAPVAASIGADALLGNSILPSYSGISNAQRNGQQLPAEVYTEFLMGASGELQRRGRMGHRMAILLGEEFAKENIKIPDLLKEIEASNQAHKHGKKAKFDERIEGLLATAEAQQKAADAQRKVQPAAGAQAQLHSQKSMVERVNNSKGGKDIVVQGKHTSRLKQEIANKDQMLISGVTPS